MQQELLRYYRNAIKALQYVIYIYIYIYIYICVCVCVCVCVSVKWVHCHHGMARPQVADRGDGLQIWRVAANILNKQSRTADSGLSSSLGVER
jgi:hypothetical protein